VAWRRFWKERAAANQGIDADSPSNMTTHLCVCGLAELADLHHASGGALAMMCFWDCPGYSHLCVPAGQHASHSHLGLCTAQLAQQAVCQMSSNVRPLCLEGGAQRPR
jgi:hypothetical protein